MASVSYWRDYGPLPGNVVWQVLVTGVTMALYLVVVWRVSVTGVTLALYLVMWYGECQLLA